ncbi:LysM domain-containing protein [Lactobacillus juensis]|uniref:LysM peptidoglycan-binding domain-containing protein n=1 Tax=Lactobacillus juensis TaxID=3082862 RepID=UPI0030C6B504
MNNYPKGPYQHYERPQKPRVETYSSVSKGWIALIILIIVVLISLVPVVHHLAVNNNSHEKVVEVRKTSKKAHTKTKAKVAPVKNKEFKAKAKPKPKSSKKTPTKPKKKRVTIKQYVVQDGDSLTSIAQHFNISVSHLAELNQLDPNSQVDTGQTLRIR